MDFHVRTLNFEWEDNLVTTITRIAVDEGFDPYKVRADLEDLKNPNRRKNVKMTFGVVNTLIIY